jgi:hypothetical protein
MPVPEAGRILAARLRSRAWRRAPRLSPNPTDEAVVGTVLVHATVGAANLLGLEASGATGSSENRFDESCRQGSRALIKAKSDQKALRSRRGDSLEQASYEILALMESPNLANDADSGVAAASPDGVSAFVARVLDQLALSAWLPAAFLTASVAILLEFRSTKSANILKAVQALTAHPSGLSGAVPDRCPRRAGSHRRSTAQRWRRAWPARRGSAGTPAAGSPSPGGRRSGRCSARSAGGRAGGGCWCRTSARSACGARPAASRALPGRPRPTAAAMNGASAANQARLAASYRTRPACRRSTALWCQAPKARRPSPGPRGTPAQPGRMTSASAGKRSSGAPGQPTITAPGRQPVTAGQPANRVFGRHSCLRSVRGPWRCRRRMGRGSTLGAARVRPSAWRDRQERCRRVGRGRGSVAGS